MKKVYWIRKVVIASALVGLVICAFCFTQPSRLEQPSQFAQPIQSQLQPEVDIETYVRSQLTQEDVVPGLVPAVIYYRRPGMDKEKYCCVGTLCPDPNNAPQIITAEHIFRTDIRREQIISVRPLRGKMDPPVAYIGNILVTGKELGGPSNKQGIDIVIASLTLAPVAIKPYSEFVLSEQGQNFWCDVVIVGKKIPRLRSVLSGEYVETLGYVRRGTEETDPVFVMINRSSRSGESGTGYVDDFGGLWVLHASAGTEEIEKQICEEGRKLAGRNIVGVSTVSGPLFGQYE